MKEKTGAIYYTFPLDVEMSSFRKVDLRDLLRKNRHNYEYGFLISLPSSALSDQRNPDKTVLHKRILELRAQGMSYRQIAKEVGLHWTRIGQILRKPNQND